MTYNSEDLTLAGSAMIYSFLLAFIATAVLVTILSAFASAADRLFRRLRRR